MNRRVLTLAERTVLEEAAQCAEVEWGMLDYGTLKSRTCVGVVGSLDGVLSFIRRVTMADPWLAEELVSGCASDNMGRYTLIYYWPGVTVDE